MEKHPYFNLNIYSTTELEQLIQKPIATIKTLREWPLSSVVEVVCADSSKWIVKYMREPLTIEGDFLNQVNKPFLPTCEHIISLPPDQQVLIYQKIDGIHPSAANFTEEQTLILMDKLLVAIQTITEKNLPARITIDTPVNFTRHFSEMLDDMKKLIGDGNFTICGSSDVVFLQTMLDNSDIVARLTNNPGYAHGDLGEDNILLRPDGSFIIMDWQRVIRSSPLIDAFLFLDSLGIPPLRHLPIESLYLAHLERIEWYMANAIKWNPGIMDRIDQYIFGFISELRLVYPTNISNFKM